MRRVLAVLLAGGALVVACGPQSPAPPPSAGAAAAAPGPAAILPAVPPASPTAEPPAAEFPAPEPPHPAPPAPLPAPPAPEPRQRHVDVRGLYMTGWTVGAAERFRELVDFMLQAGLNAAVIDAKDDDGQISWPVDVPLAKEIGADRVVKIADIRGRLRYLEERGIYPIARVVVYADPLLGARRPDLAIMGGRFTDARGIRWPDPYNQEVWRYNVAVGRAAAEAGFREVQFDYIRFPEYRLSGYNYQVPVAQRTEAIAGFLRYARSELSPLGVFISADVFGLTTSVAEGDDMELGQDYAQIAAITDYIKPMVYPSHYAPGTYGIADPNQEPGRVVYESLVRAQLRTLPLDVKKHRPWIQDFHLGKRFTRADVEAQILGLARAGIYQYLVWDPNNRYTRDVNHQIALPPGDGREPEWRVEHRRRLAADRRARAGAREI